MDAVAADHRRSRHHQDGVRFRRSRSLALDHRDHGHHEVQAEVEEEVGSARVKELPPDSGSSRIVKPVG